VTYRLGIDVGDRLTTWAVIAGAPDHDPDTGTVDSMVTLVHADDVHVVRDFVRLLGQPEPIIVGGTPYGAEALVSRLVSGVLGSVRQPLGEDPAAVVLLHDDGLDPYRSGLYAEALRLAGVPTAAAFVVPRSEARAAAPGASSAIGAAAVGWQRVPSPVDDDSNAGAAVVLGTGATGAAVIAAVLGDAVDGGLGFPGAAGPQGSGLANAGPAGSPLGASGPAGTSLPAPGATTGAPLAGPPAPPGTPLAAPGTSPPPLAGPPAPANISTDTTSGGTTSGGTTSGGTTSGGTTATGSTPTTSPTPGSPGGAPPGGAPPHGRPPEAFARPELVELAPVGFTWWRRWWVFPLAFAVVLLVSVPVVFLLGRSDSTRTVVAASTTTPATTTSTVRPTPSVLAPPSSSAATTVASTTTSTTTTVPTTTVPATTSPPSTVARTVPRTTVAVTVPATVPATAAATVPPTVAATTSTTVPPNTPPTVGAISVSPAPVTACGPSTIFVDVSDTGGIASVTVGYSYAIDKVSNGSGTVNLTGPAGGGTWSGSFTLPLGTTYGLTPLALTVTANDTQALSGKGSAQSEATICLI
jgi:hypothetical protein